jgi:hypothetical protein
MTKAMDGIAPNANTSIMFAPGKKKGAAIIVRTNPPVMLMIAIETMN